ncbi:MAG TPA: aminomethyltransferase family protein, partial [Candidatus Limnocylindria bacterium]|nr:aminomethyltransferase family protein [Candidatus Limnocylindria bacterium]
SIVNLAARRYIFTAMTKTLPLADFHRENGAVFVERDDWLLPAHFVDIAAEYRAVRSTAGLMDLSHRGLLQFTGPDRLAFLQGMLSNDLKLLKPFDGKYATLLTQQGKVIADVRVLCSLNSFYLDFWDSLKAKILDHINRYLVADEVEIADRSGEYATLSIQGPRSEALLRQLVGPAELPEQLWHHAMVSIDGAAVCVVSASHTGEPGFDLIAPRSSLADLARRLTDAGKTYFAAVWVGEEAQNILRIEAGIPRYGVDFSEDNLLLEVGIDHAVSFSKGCYLGQEVVERIRSRGHVNKKLCGLLIDGAEPAHAGDLVQVDGKNAGKITSSVISPRFGRPVALAYLHKDFWAPGTQVFIHSGESRRSATVSSLPFPAAS